MSEKEARIRLTVKTDSFKAGMADVRREVVNMTKAAAGVGSTLAQGFGMGSLGALAGMTQRVMQLGGLLGGLGIMDVVRDNIALEKSFRDLAMNMQWGTGQAVSYEKVLAGARKQTAGLGIDMNKAGAAMNILWEGTGDMALTEKALGVAATSSRATGQSIEVTANQINGLLDSFDVAPERLGDTMAAVMELGNKGGVSLKEVGFLLENIGPKARSAGIQGEDGVKRMLGMLNLVRDLSGTKKQATAATTQFLSDLGTPGSDMEKRAAKAMPGYSIDKRIEGGASPEQIFTELIAGTKGDQKKLREIFGRGPLYDAAVKLGKTYNEAADGVKDSQGKVVAGTQAIADALTSASTTTKSYADMQKSAAEQMKSTSATLDEAKETIAAAFETEEVRDLIRSGAQTGANAVTGAVGAVDKASKATGISGLGIMGGAYVGGMGIQSALASAAGTYGVATTGAFGVAGAAATKRGYDLATDPWNVVDADVLGRGVRSYKVGREQRGFDRSVRALNYLNLITAVAQEIGALAASQITHMGDGAVGQAKKIGSFSRAALKYSQMFPSAKPAGPAAPALPDADVNPGESGGSGAGADPALIQAVNGVGDKTDSAVSRLLPALPGAFRSAIVGQTLRVDIVAASYQPNPSGVIP